MIIQHFLFFYYMGEFTPYFMVLIFLFHACRHVEHAGGEEAFYLVGEGVFLRSKESWKLKHKGR